MNLLGFRNRSIRVKLTLAVVATSVFTLALACCALIVSDQSSFEKGLAENAGLMTEILAYNCVSAVEFEDDATAVEVLQSLKSDSHVVWAAVILPNETKFAAYVRANETVPSSMPDLSEDGIFSDGNTLTVRRPIMSDDEEIGRLWLCSDLDEKAARLESFVGSSLLFSLAAALIGLLVAARFQRVISQPIKELEDGARQLAVGNLDFNIKYESKDEIGALADTFRSLKDYLETLSDAAERIAANDLSVIIEPRSETDVLGNAFKKMSSNLVRMIRQLGQHAQQLVAGVAEIEASSEQMSKGAREQAEQVSGVSAAVEEMTANITESSKGATDASSASREASETASTGGRIVTETIDGMRAIAEVVRQSADSIGDLAESAEQIGEIISVIDDIADQTNLLALNAAIEAARAGEQGRGFAVVADEVRKLAERTGTATAEISNVIKEVQSKTSGVVQSMESGIVEVDKGRELADQAGSSLGEIVQMSQSVMNMVEQIAQVSDQQTAVANEVAQSVEAISSVTESTARQSEESLEAAKMLNDQAEELQQIVSSFKM